MRLGVLRVRLGVLATNEMYNLRQISRQKGLLNLLQEMFASLHDMSENMIEI